MREYYEQYANKADRISNDLHELYAKCSNISTAYSL